MAMGVAQARQLLEQRMWAEEAAAVWCDPGSFLQDDLPSECDRFNGIYAPDLWHDVELDPIGKIDSSWKHVEEFGAVMARVNDLAHASFPSRPGYSLTQPGRSAWVSEGDHRHWEEVSQSRGSTSHVRKTVDLKAVYEKHNCDLPVTTLMLRNLPNNFSRSRLMKVLDENGFENLYDFVHVPLDSATHSCLAYAFVNLEDASTAERFTKQMNGFLVKWDGTRTRTLHVSPAHIQGLEANLAHLQASAVFYGDPALRPWFRQQSKPIPAVQRSSEDTEESTDTRKAAKAPSIGGPFERWREATLSAAANTAASVIGEDRGCTSLPMLEARTAQDAASPPVRSDVSDKKMADLTDRVRSASRQRDLAETNREDRRESRLQSLPCGIEGSPNISLPSSEIHPVTLPLGIVQQDERRYDDRSSEDVAPAPVSSAAMTAATAAAAAAVQQRAGTKASSLIPGAFHMWEDMHTASAREDTTCWPGHFSSLAMPQTSWQVEFQGEDGMVDSLNSQAAPFTPGLAAWLPKCGSLKEQHAGGQLQPEEEDLEARAILEDDFLLSLTAPSVPSHQAEQSSIEVPLMAPTVDASAISSTQETLASTIKAKPLGIQEWPALGGEAQAKAVSKSSKKKASQRMQTTASTLQPSWLVPLPSTLPLADVPCEEKKSIAVPANLSGNADGDPVVISPTLVTATEVEGAFAHSKSSVYGRLQLLGMRAALGKTSFPRMADTSCEALLPMTMGNDEPEVVLPSERIHNSKAQLIELKEQGRGVQSAMPPVVGTRHV
jgi:hypothetical protein